MLVCFWNVYGYMFTTLLLDIALAIKYETYVCYDFSICVMCQQDFNHMQVATKSSHYQRSASNLHKLDNIKTTVERPIKDPQNGAFLQRLNHTSVLT